MRIKAIPTEYAGVRFRSVLEAKWGAFFDLAGWRWEYEPLELVGYIPDFVVYLAAPLLVEVKPFLWDGNEDEEQLVGHARVKIDQSGWMGESLILGVGARPFGLFRSADGWSGASGYLCNDCGRNTPYHDDASWRCRCCGSDIHARIRMQPWNISADLRRAANLVQWRTA